MLLTIDMGNTNITLGVFRGETLLFESRLATDHTKTADQYTVELKSVLRLYEANLHGFRGAILSSVVPALDQSVCDAVRRVTGITPLRVGPGIRTGLNIRIDDPAQLGADLLTGAVAAVAKYGAPCIIWDLGTATTVSAVDADCAFRGGAIMPGVRTSYNSLSAAASLLPSISLEAPARAICGGTVDCMRSGAVYGNAAMIDGMSARFREELGCDAPIIATGGLSREIVTHCRLPVQFDDTLLLDGLRLLWEKND